jgi:hypothetical protein
MYKDLREPFRPPETEDIFNMVTKETPKTFYIGKLLEARYKISFTKSVLFDDIAIFGKFF